MRTVAIPITVRLPATRVLRPGIEGDTAHFLTVNFRESVASDPRLAGDDIRVTKSYDFDKDFLPEPRTVLHTLGVV